MQLFSKEKETNEATFEKERAELKAEAADNLLPPTRWRRKRLTKSLLKKREPSLKNWKSKSLKILKT